MDAGEPGWALIDDFFADLAVGRSAATVRRYVRVRQRLGHFLDTADMTLGLGGDRTILLEAERQFHPDGAFWTIYGADELVACLPSFLHETWLPRTRAEARMQISVTSRLVDHLVRSGLLSATTPRHLIVAVARAVDHARDSIEPAATTDEGSNRMPRRFLQQPGPEW